MSFGHMVTTVPQTEATPHLYYIPAWLFAQPLGPAGDGNSILNANCAAMRLDDLFGDRQTQP